MSQASPAPSHDLAALLAGASAPVVDENGENVHAKPATPVPDPKNVVDENQTNGVGNPGAGTSPEPSAATTQPGGEDGPETTGGSKRGGAKATREYTRKREGVDWELVEAEYRCGVLSLRVISRKHGMSSTRLRDRAKKHGWERDLSDAVRRQARGELLREDAAAQHNAGIKGDPHAQASIVKGAAATQVQVVRDHRKDLAKLGRIQRRLFKRLDELTGVEGGEERLRSLSMLTEAAQITEALSRNAHRLIPLERQAFSLDAKGSESPGAGVSAIEERTRRFMADRQKAAEVEKAKATERAVQAGKADGTVASIEERIRPGAGAGIPGEGYGGGKSILT